MRKPIIAGNWKMNMTTTEAVVLVESLKKMLETVQVDREVVLCPPFTALTTVSDLIEDTDIRLGAQSVHQETSGAYTGEVSAPMLAGIGCSYVIVGHSERREYFKETDDIVRSKLVATFTQGMTPILCVGENLEQRESGDTMRIIEGQLEADLAGLPAVNVEELVIAYEPIWAIGTGKTATAAQAGEVCTAIRQKIAKLYGSSVADKVRIQYGGSVKGSNAAELLSQPDIDGALVGGASLKAEDFMAIIVA